MLAIFFILIALVVITLLIAAARQPSEFRITRTAIIETPAQAVFEQVNDLHKWDAWSPWAKLDPQAKNFFEGPSSGVGAIMRWAGNNKVGEGSMTIVESRPNEFIQFKLEFLKPFKAVNTAEFAFKSEDHRTAVTWSMFGTNNFIAKVMNLFINCDKMVGAQFEQGLAAMKAVVETEPAA